MLDNHFRKRLKEHSWDELERHDTNKSQTWKRKRKQAVNAILDLTLLAQKLPIEKKREIFRNEILIKFIRMAIFDRFTGRTLDMILVSDLISICLRLVIKRYREINKHSPHLSNYTIEQIERTENICSDIANLIHSIDLKRESIKNDEVYLFRVKDGKVIIDMDNFSDYIIELVKQMDKGKFVDTDGDFLEYYASDSSHLNIKVRIIDPSVTEMDNANNVIGSVTILMEPLDSQAHLIITVFDVKKTKKLTMKYDSDRKIYTFYQKLKEKDYR